MSPAASPPAASEPQIALEAGTYEIIRNRLTSHGRALRERLAQLNDARRAVFGSIETELTGTARITTEHNCQPRDMIVVGRKLLFGYNIQFGLKTETHVRDVFSVYSLTGSEFRQEPLDLVASAQFERDFAEVYRYYKQAVFAKFVASGPHLYMVFRVGKAPTDIKAFKWVQRGESLEYLDNRSDHEVRLPPQHQFTWTRTTRDMHHFGQHPHVSIEDRMFVETVGGDLTIKIENNTATGAGIYAEPVDNADQTLDDAEIYYAIVGNIILLKIRPYQEKAFRYIVFNEKTSRAQRLDAIADACVLLPDDHGLIFSNGYYLQSGEGKTFETKIADMRYERRIAAPNGEDFLYVFYEAESGVYVLLAYHLIEQRVDTPLVCHGFTIYDTGEMLCFQSEAEAQKHHVMQIWRTPLVSEANAPHAQADAYLAKIGNRDIVRAMAECHEVLALIERPDIYASLYVDIVKRAADVIDSYFWLASGETFNLKEPLSSIRETAAAAIDEFEKVVRAQRSTAEQTARVSSSAREIIGATLRRRFEHINEFVESLGALRRVRGEIIALRDLRYVDTTAVAALEAEVAKDTERLAHRCVEFLLKPDALAPYVAHAQGEMAKIPAIKKVADAREVGKSIAGSAGELEMLIEIVSNLRIDDATQRTTIVDNISSIFAVVNQARAGLKQKIKELASVEGVAEFNSQIKLLNQAIVNYLDVCDTPAKCEEYLTKIMVQFEELEGRFAEFDEFVVQLAEKRDEVYSAFETRRLQLVETRNQRASALLAAAERILKGIKARVDAMDAASDIHGYFAGDLMLEKVRDIVAQLDELGDSVKVADIQSRLKTIREDAVRQLKDRDELYVGGKNVIQFGQHQFAVNVQPLDLTTVLRDGKQTLHLTGTGFFEPITDDELNQLADVWRQEVVSENEQVYRGEYLAYRLLRAAEGREASTAEGEPPTLAWLAEASDDALVAYVQRFMGPRYAEAYSKGVHDRDAATLVRALAEMQLHLGLLRFGSPARAMARVWWTHFADAKHKAKLAAKLQGCGLIGELFPAAGQQHYVRELEAALRDFAQQVALFDEPLAGKAAAYLCEELKQDQVLAVSRTAFTLHEEFLKHLQLHNFADKFAKSLAQLASDIAARYALARDWTRSYIASRDDDERDFADEVAALLCNDKFDRTRVLDGHAAQELSGMAGSHPLIASGKYQLHFNHFHDKLSRYCNEVVPRFQRFAARKQEIVSAARDDMRLEEFRPRVLTSFVRNKLIDEVYLPLIGDNLAKQIGVVGEGKRTDLMGLLLLVSPPGYGKTTLMEYVANRLGIIFMKINGPAIGHHVTSLDPSEAKNAAAREEVEKLNLALEMGDNVMIYLDDIQHVNPELLQKFISLCDATRKIEGVYKGRTRTYDLRGKTVAVAMAGNPYTESGEKFKIPDMLANRADVYNLGEIIGDTREAFEMSFIENALTSNSVLSKIASRAQSDVYEVLHLAERGPSAEINLTGSYSPEELNELVAVMQKLLRVRDVILKVNREYIRSAAQADDYRTEPPFKLQGSYRNMNRIAGKVAAIMNDAELTTLILSSYENDAQTLTTDQEANMLKFKELMGILTPVEASRWDDIQRTFQQNVKLRGMEAGGEAAQMLAQLGTVSDGLHAIRKALAEGVGRLAEPNPTAAAAQQQLAVAIDELRSLKSGIDAIGATLSGGLAHLTAPATPAAGDGESSEKAQKVIVQHRVPKTVADVLAHQFNLMQSWMQPVLSATNLHSAEIRNLQRSVEATLEAYATLIEELKEASPRPPPVR